MKKLFILLIVTIMVLTGCSNKTQGNQDGEVTTLTFFSADLTQDDPFDNPVAQKITELTGVKLEISHPVGGDTQAIPVMIAGGDYPDLIFAKGDINKMIEADALLPLDDLIEKKGDNLKAMYGDQINRLRSSLEDPQIYHVGTGGVENEYHTTSGTMLLQLDVLRELGYPEIKTLEDYENAIKQYIEKYPEIDGQPTIGMSLLGSDWRWLITVGNPAGFVSGYQDDGQWIVDEDNNFETTYKFRNEDFKKYYRWLNGMYNQGLLDPESFTQGEDDYIAKLSSGRVLGIADQDWNFSSATAALRQDEKYWRTYAPLPVALEDGIKVQSVKDYGFTGTIGISIAKDSPNAEKAFEFLDWFASEEAQILVNWGIEGVNYDIVDGKRVAKEEDIKNSLTNNNYSLETGIGQYIYPFPQAGSAVLDSNGQSISRSDRERVIQDYTEAEKEVLSNYGAEMWVDLFPSREEFDLPKHGRGYEIVMPTDLGEIQTRADDYMAQALTKLITTKAENFDNVWDEIQKDLIDMNIEEAEKQMTELVRNRVKLWEGEY